MLAFSPRSYCLFFVSMFFFRCDYYGNFRRVRLRLITDKCKSFTFLSLFSSSFVLLFRLIKYEKLNSNSFFCSPGVSISAMKTASPYVFLSCAWNERNGINVNIMRVLWLDLPRSKFHVHKCVYRYSLSFVCVSFDREGYCVTWAACAFRGGP